MRIGQQGITLIQVLILGTLVATAATFLIKANTEAKKAFRTTYAKEELSDVLKHITALLVDPDRCSDIFGGYKVSELSNFSKLQTSQNIIYYEVGPKKFYGVNRGILVKKMMLRDRKDDPTANVTFFIEFGFTDEIYGYQTLLRGLPLSASIGDNGIFRCQYNIAEVSDIYLEKFCRGSGAVYTDGRCYVDALKTNGCFAGQVMVGIEKSPNNEFLYNPICKSFTQLKAEASTACKNYVTGISLDTGGNDCADLDSSFVRKMFIMDSAITCIEGEIAGITQEGGQYVLRCRQKQ